MNSQPNTTKFPKVCILILNWNGWKDTIECLESVFRISYPNYQVIVIDNGSTDGSVEKIKEWAEGKQKVLTVETSHPLYNLSYPQVPKPILYVFYKKEETESGGNNKFSQNYPLILVQNGENLGFAAGNNVGLRYALKKGFDYVLLLNNDTVVDKGFLSNLVKMAHDNEEAGIIGGKIYFYDKANTIQSLGVEINLKKGDNLLIGCGKLDQGQYDYVNKVDGVSGALMLIKHDVFNKVGLLDEDYFLYTEDVDFCYRVSRTAFNIIVEPKAIIWHKVSATSGSFSTTYFHYFTNNRFLFIKKHFNSKFSYKLIFAIQMIKLIIFCLKKANFKGVEAIIRGLYNGFFKIS